MIVARVKKRLGGFLLDAEVNDEGFVHIWGANGAGKSTLLDIIAGVRQPDAGSVLVNSEDVTEYPLERRGVVLVRQDSCIPHLGVEDHLTWGARARGARVEPSYISNVKAALGITFSGKVSQLSTGMRERVSLATALVSKPEVVLADEVFSNISARLKFLDAYRRLCREAGIDVLFTSQVDDLGPDSVDHCYKMDAGKTVRQF